MIPDIPPTTMSSLPPELWIEVFQWIASPANPFYATKCEPFQSYPQYDLDDVLRVKYNLIRVCRQWRAMAEDLLYEDLRIRHGDRTLAKVLENSEVRGRWVRRAELPYSNTATATLQPLPSLAILKSCSQLQVLVRPAPDKLEDLRFEFGVDGLQFQSLKRLEWFNHNDAARSGGINSLDHVLASSPKLQYLSLGGELRLNQLRPPRQLPLVSTIRLRAGMNALFFRQVSRWILPSLVHVVADQSPGTSLVEIVWQTFGSQLQLVEIGRHLRFLIEDHLTPILHHCPNLLEINYYLLFTAPPRRPVEHSSLQTIRLHGNPNAMLMAVASVWQHVEQHFALFTGTSLPNLQRIILYDDWSSILSDYRFDNIHRALDARRCDLELPDGRVVSL